LNQGRKRTETKAMKTITPERRQKPPAPGEPLPGDIMGTLANHKQQIMVLPAQEYLGRKCRLG